jgi:hypothetical protein
MNYHRFIIAPSELVDQEQLIILTDVQYWKDNWDALNQWCLGRDADTAGMAVVLGSERTLVEFILRWA